MRYRPGLPFVLKGLSMSVKGGEKIGVVGRCVSCITGLKPSDIQSGRALGNRLSCWLSFE